MRVLLFVTFVVSNLLSIASQAADRIGFEFALYFSPKPVAEAEDALAILVKAEAAEFSLTQEASCPIHVSTRWSDLTDYALPSEESFKYFAIGLKPADRALMSKAERAFVVSFSTTKPYLLKANRLSCHLIGELAKQTGANLWDEETRQIFSLKAWKERRLEGWQGDIPDASKHVTMHAYRDPELTRLITLGLRKFGVPDLVMTGVASHQSDPAGNLVNATMQRLVEGAFPVRRRLVLKLDEIKHEAVRRIQKENPGEGAKAEVSIEFKTATRQDGDPSNELWEIEFPTAEGRTPTERQQVGLGELYGSTDKITGVSKGDPEMAAASNKAQKAFFKNESKYRAGLQLNEHLLVKTGFAHGDDDYEYMWVEVTSWKKDAIVGVLMNDPYYVKGLKSGSQVTVPLVKVYDYLFYRADGATEGNETGKVLEKREASR